MKRAITAAAIAAALAITTVAPANAASAGLYADPSSQSSAAAASDSRLAGLAAVPQGKWFTDWTTVASIGSDVSTYVTAANSAGKTPIVVLYEIPGRDCGSYSSGGLPNDDAYRAWIDGAASALVGHDSIVILEPDAIPLLSSCTPPGDRLGLLTYASQKLAATGARVYLDAGHSNWQTPAAMAQSLVSAGVQYTRGFSTNVANFQTTDAEMAYGTAVASELTKLGVADKHFIIDTGRNGAGSSGDICNPPSARIGVLPQQFTSNIVDAFLWVKTVGETDGSCNGGPASGFSTTLALNLLGGAQLAVPAAASSSKAASAPAKPTKLKLKRSGKAIVATWKKVAGATSYRVVFTGKKSGSKFTSVKVVKKASAKLAHPAPKAKYTVTVSAVKSGVVSKKSSAKKITSR